MKIYYLKEKTTNEVLMKTRASNEEEVIKYFSEIKKLDIADLLYIYFVTDQL